MTTGKMARKTLATALMLASAMAMADAQVLELYVDSNTKQIFSEPGPNRVKIGTFRSVDNPADTKQENTASIDLVEMRQELELRQRELEEKLDKIAMAPAPKPAKKNWAETMKVRGYMQIRSNPIIGGDKDISHQADRSIGDNNNFLIRRMRLIFFGDIGERLSYYIQPDFASRTGDGTGNIAQLRDAYGDIYLTKDRVHRLRVGQSKIPYSFENLQSSQNRIALDRNDALNSCCKDERDLGVFYYYTPEDKQEMFKYLVDSGLKGSGNYGVFAFGAYNGTGANRAENNDNLHLVSRFTYPVKFENGQIFEAGIQGIYGTFKPSRSGTVVADSKTDGFKDQRVGVHAVLYPQPFGLQAEWNWGKGPSLNDAGTMIEETSLNGGYIQAMYRITDFFGYGVMLPFVKWQYYDGAQKFESNAPQNHVNDWEAGFEWQPVPEIEFTAYYSKLDRNNLATAPYSKYNTDILRFQLQYNF
ncbi:porin [Methylobacillus flagellatus]|uniref:Phosphate-selective porin O and P n=1 Tax=Methylobacillus flagellatus (strain ATCC 51484 / DSM 6875 / VKM B-1610 / KT) TaxID=265072 RepID=Q1H368_METFK|nr:porin [Methylobacillus flagellatus]ABE49069.1 phosphate-selective porin O and P [Methylobacillus flagellatus KT]